MNFTTTATDTEQKNISVWFECKSCKFTFPFRTVAEFLDHKKQKHLAEFQKAQCIVFEERLQNELATNNFDQNSETKLFAQDDDVELCTSSGTSETFSEISELSSLKTPPLPVPVLHQLLPPPLNLSHKDDTPIQTIVTSDLQENTRQEYELNADFGLFPICLPSAHNSTVSDPCGLQADLIPNDSSAQTAVEAHHLVPILVDVENNYENISSDHLSPDFSFLDDNDDNIDVPSEVDNVENTDSCNFNSPNPYVSLRRLSAKELLSSHHSNNLKNTLTKIDILYGPFACTICSKSYKTKAALGNHMNTHSEFKRAPRRFQCSYPDCSSSFDKKSALIRHTERHESSSNKPFFKFPLPDNDTDLNEGNLLTLREWLIQQKLTPEKSNNSSENTETVNIIRLDPDPTEMDEATDKAFKISRETPIKCKLCSKNLESEAEVKIHVMHCWLRNERRHCYCAPCDKSLSNPRVLKTHTKALHAEGVRMPANRDRPRQPKRVYKCHTCSRPFKKLSTLKSHLISHKAKKEREREASFVCEICGKVYLFKNELVRHIAAHSENRPFKCSYLNCTATFKCKNFLKDHLKTHLPKSLDEHVRGKDMWQRPFECGLCGKAFFRSMSLRRHMGVHRKPQRKQSNGNSQVNVFKKTHLRKPQNVQKLFCCPKEGCSKRFTTKTILRGHLKTILHTGEPVPKSWKCDQENCDKLYGFKESWNRHRIAVHGVGGEPLPTFQCQICNKTFGWKQSLNRHLGSHTGERRFKCSYDGCGKAYRDKKSLDEHIRGKHTGERPFQCELCGKAYYRTISLRVHMGVHRRKQSSSTSEINI